MQNLSSKKIYEITKVINSCCAFTEDLLVSRMFSCRYKQVKYDVSVDDSNNKINNSGEATMEDDTDDTQQVHICDLNSMIKALKIGISKASTNIHVGSKTIHVEYIDFLNNIDKSNIRCTNVIHEQEDECDLIAEASFSASEFSSCIVNSMVLCRPCIIEINNGSISFYTTSELGSVKMTKQLLTMNAEPICFDVNIKYMKPFVVYILQNPTSKIVNVFIKRSKTTYTYQLVVKYNNSGIKTIVTLLSG